MIVNRQTIMWNLFQGMEVLESPIYGFKIEKNSHSKKYESEFYVRFCN